jgi:transposase InsO family protein
MAERSRRPRTSPRATAEDLAAELLEARRERPYWGAKKLLWSLWGPEPPMSLSTANRLLARHGLACRKERARPQRFERDSPNELWQADYKVVGPRGAPCSVLSVIDDATRFLVALAPVPAQTAEDTFEALWRAFGDYGLPERLLTDNGTCFASTKRGGPGGIEPYLWRLGVMTSHGRPMHPQTQGKVERFHRTLQLELGSALLQPSSRDLARVLGAYRQAYNWERPHEAIGMAVPGSIYRPSERTRPARLPHSRIPPGADARCVDASGKFSWAGQRYRAGKGLAGEQVEIRELPTGLAACYAGVLVGHLEELKVVTMS